MAITPHHQRGHSDSGDPDGAEHDHADMGDLNSMALSATLHCLTGCAIGEIAGLMIGTGAGLSNGWTIFVSITLAFVFGYTLSTFPLLRAGLSVGAALSVVLAADTLSIASMEVVDNAVMTIIPGAMDAGLVNATFWFGMMIALTSALFAAFPVNRYLLHRGKGHALTHRYHGAAEATGARRLIPSFATSTLVAVIVAFMLGGLVVSIADQVGNNPPTPNVEAGTPQRPLHRVDELDRRGPGGLTSRPALGRRAGLFTWSPYCPAVTEDDALLADARHMARSGRGRHRREQSGVSWMKCGCRGVPALELMAWELGVREPR